MSLAEPYNMFGRAFPFCLPEIETPTTPSTFNYVDVSFETFSEVWWRLENLSFSVTGGTMGAPFSVDIGPTPTTGWSWSVTDGSYFAGGLAAQVPNKRVCGDSPYENYPVQITGSKTGTAPQEYRINDFKIYAYCVIPSTELIRCYYRFSFLGREAYLPSGTQGTNVANPAWGLISPVKSTGSFDFSGISLQFEAVSFENQTGTTSGGGISCTTSLYTFP